MPLSDHEQRLLDQIERALYAEDPKFATAVRATDLRTHYRRRIVRGAVLFVVGLGVLLAGVATTVIAVGVAGFLVMFGAAFLVATSWKRLGGARPGQAAPTRAPQERRARVMERLEERWRRRREERG